MSIDEIIVRRISRLPPSKQREVVDLLRVLEESDESGSKGPDRADAGDLERTPRTSRPLSSLRGLCKDLGTGPTAEEIDEARQQLWGGFPREDVL